MKTLFIISVIGIIVTVTIMVLHKKITGRHFLETFVGGISLFICLALSLTGIIVLPLVNTYKTEYTKIENYDIIKNEHSVILDLTNSPQLRYEKLLKFDSHEFVENYNDSIQFFIKREKSFYGLTVYCSVVWSKPPYKEFFK